jgi:hypothetical protein
MSNPDEWLEKVKRCEYLPEQDVKKLCEMVTRFYILLYDGTKLVTLGERVIVRRIEYTTSAFTCYCLW